MNTFYPGQKVVCIDDKFPHVSNDQGIREGQVYTLRWVGMYRSYVDGDFLGVKLADFNRGTCELYGHVDPPFAARRFKPLVEDPIAIFRAIAADPGGFKPAGPDGPLRVPEKEKEEV